MNWAKVLLSPNNSLNIFCAVIFIFYMVVPFTVWALLDASHYFVVLSGLTCLALISIWIGSKIPAFDYRFHSGSKWLRVNGRYLIFFTWFVFLIFMMYVFLTSPTIPLVSALQGADASTLSEERGAFLKGRDGAEAALGYVSALFVNTLVPYSIVSSFLLMLRIRFLLVFLFAFYCISFMQKALFLNVLLPLVVLFSINGCMTRKKIVYIFLFIITLLTVLVCISFENNEYGIFLPIEYYSAKYVPSGAIDYLIWRIFSVPIFTASDTLLVHNDLFSSSYMLGATSSFFSLFFGLERINIERYVFEYQFGSWNDIANSNAVFFLDGYLNFGLVGVVIYGLIVGQIFRLLRYSKDFSFKCLWPILVIGLFSGSLIGTLLSNGWFLLLLSVLMVNVKENSKKYSIFPCC